MATPQDLLVALSRAYALTETLRGDDPELVEALDAAGEMHEAIGWLVVRPGEHGFSVSQEEVPAPEGELADFRDALVGSRVQELRLQEPMASGVLEDFLRRLRPSDAEKSLSGSARFRGLEGAIGLSFGEGAASPLGMAGLVQRLFSAGEEEPGASPSAEEWMGEEEAPVRPALPSELEELLESFLSATGSRKVQLGEAIAAAGARLEEARDLGTLANLVEALSETSRGGPPDPEALDLATRLTTTGVASHLVGRLGSTREEVERKRLIRISAQLGREMALALADALGEARDRYQRRSFMDAMAAHGPLALEMAQTMVEDPRWYVVRNGVSLLGELGGEDVVSHLTTALANGDHRVRRETVKALAKLGGEDSAMLLLGMLDDPEGDVRAKACRALGVLKVGRAFKPLLKLLEKDNNEEVQVESLEALGKIGDPGAVPLIERRTVGRIFSRPSKEVRLAAYRALAGIGTPHARNLLLKATKDSDMDVRKLALGLME